MKRGRELIGLPVMDGRNRQVAGEVVDLLFDHSGGLKALVVSFKALLFRREKPIPLEAFERIDADGAYVHVDRSVMERRPDLGEALFLSAKNDGLCGRALFTKDGKQVGVVGDVILDCQPYALWGFEVSDGIVMDLLDGRPIVEAGGCLIEDERIVLGFYT